MSQALDLIKAVLGLPVMDDAQALHLLATALEAEIDPLAHCAIVAGISQTLAMERAAAWAGYAFFDKVPQGLAGEIEPMQLEDLAGVRLFRMHLFDRAVDFAAPDFVGLLRLKQRLDGNPALRRRICLLPASALRNYLTVVAAPELITAARQGLAQRWPYAAAQLELTAPARYGFALGVLLLLALVLLAPFVAEFWLCPVALSLLVAPAAIRVAALGTAPRPLPAPRRPPDAELPVYSVLISLRNEAAMVPQLFAAMWALDYPALGSKRTNRIRGNRARKARKYGHVKAPGNQHTHHQSQPARGSHSQDGARHRSRPKGSGARSRINGVV